MSGMLRSGKGNWTFLVACTMLAVVGQAYAEADTPSGHEVIRKFVDVSGGQDAYAKIRNRVIKAKLDLPDHGMEGDLIEILAPPNYHRIVAIDVYDANVIGITDGVAWSSNGEEASEPLEDALAADVKRHAQLNPFLDWTPESGEAMVVGDATIGDDECYRVEIVPAAGAPLLAFFSTKTGLLRRIDNRTVNMYRYFDDYRKQDGVLVPYALRVDAGMMMADLEIISIEQNIDLDNTAIGQPLNIDDGEK